MPTLELERLRHQFIYDVTTRLENLSLNTVVSGLMEYTNKLYTIDNELGGLDKETLDTIAILLAPFAPHMAEQLWEILGYTKSVFAQCWPSYEFSKMRVANVNIAVQIDGKLRGSIAIPIDLDEKDVVAEVKKAFSIRMNGVDIVQQIYVPGKIISLLTKIS